MIKKRLCLVFFVCLFALMPLQASAETPISEQPDGPYIAKYMHQVTQGFTLPLEVSMRPEGDPVPSHSWRSLQSSIATIDKNGLIKGVALGVAKINLRVDGRVVAECKVEVLPNIFEREAPLEDTRELVYVSTKSLRYEDKYLIAEVFILNKTTEPVDFAGELFYGFLVDWERDEGAGILLATPVTVVLDTPLAPGESMVLSFPLPVKILKEQYGTLDLRNKRYEAFLTAQRDEQGNLIATHATPLEGISGLTN